MKVLKVLKEDCMKILQKFKTVCKEFFCNLAGNKKNEI